MPNKRAGTCYVKINGEQIDVAGSVTCSPQTTEREGLAGLNGPVGFKEAGRVPFIEVEAYKPAKALIATLTALADGTVTAELADGDTCVLSNAWLAGVIEPEAGEGTTTIRFEGLDGKWL